MDHEQCNCVSGEGGCEEKETSVLALDEETKV